MNAIREGRTLVTRKDFLKAIDKVMRKLARSKESLTTSI